MSSSIDKACPFCDLRLHTVVYEPENMPWNKAAYACGTVVKHFMDSDKPTVRQSDPCKHIEDLLVILEETR